MTGTMFGWHIAAATPAAATAHGDDQSSHHHCTPMVTTPLGPCPFADRRGASPCIAPYTAGRISPKWDLQEVKCPKPTPRDRAGCRG